jgi:murein DD-endopeptidase MepM/ murein hydrolase activator NlpD
VKVMRIDKTRLLKGLIGLFLASWVLFPHSSESADRDGCNLHAPERAALGQPFAVLFSSRAPLDSLNLEWLGRRLNLPVEPDGDIWSSTALLGTDVKYVKPGKHALVIRGTSNGRPVRYEKTVEVWAKDYPAEYLTVSANMVNPPADQLARIKQESKLVGQALRTITEEKNWSWPFVHPVPGEVISVYGLKRFFNGQPRSPHRGVDFRAGIGQPIRAVNAGRVILLGNHYFAGNSVYVDHGLGVISAYFHMSEIQVMEGEAVEKGEIIGAVGSTGRVTGPHLHFGLYVLGQSVDAMAVLGDDPEIMKVSH